MQNYSGNISMVSYKTLFSRFLSHPRQNSFLLIKITESIMFNNMGIFIQHRNSAKEVIITMLISLKKKRIEAYHY